MEFEVTFELGPIKFEEEFELDGYKFFSQNDRSWATKIIKANDFHSAQKIALQEIGETIIPIEKFLKSRIQPKLVKTISLSGPPYESTAEIMGKIVVRRIITQDDINELKIAFDLMKRNELYKDALLLWTKSPVITWNELSKIVELVEDRAKIDIVKEGWISKSDYKAFFASANNASVSGLLNARHAKEYGDPPKKTMSLQQGKEIVEMILNNWKQKLLQDN
jgi:hypothetical protein